MSEDNGIRSYKNRKNLSRIIQHLEHEYTKKDDARDMDVEHEKQLDQIETDNVLLKNGIDEYQFKTQKDDGDTIDQVHDLDAIIYEQRMTDAAEHDLFLSPDALQRFKAANIKNQQSIIKTYNKRKIWKQDKLKTKNDVNSDLM